MNKLKDFKEITLEELQSINGGIRKLNVKPHSIKATGESWKIENTYQISRSDLNWIYDSRDEREQSGRTAYFTSGSGSNSIIYWIPHADGSGFYDEYHFGNVGAKGKQLRS